MSKDRIDFILYIFLLALVTDSLEVTLFQAFDGDGGGIVFKNSLLRL